MDAFSRAFCWIPGSCKAVEVMPTSTTVFNANVAPFPFKSVFSNCSCKAAISNRIVCNSDSVGLVLRYHHDAGAAFERATLRAYSMLFLLHRLAVLCRDRPVETCLIWCNATSVAFTFIPPRRKTCTVWKKCHHCRQQNFFVQVGECASKCHHRTWRVREKDVGVCKYWKFWIWIEYEYGEKLSSNTKTRSNNSCYYSFL